MNSSGMITEGYRLDRRAFFVACASVASMPGHLQSLAVGATRLYASVGRALTHYEVDVEAIALRKRTTVTVPAGVQYAWPHASRQFLYVASSNGGPGSRGDTHHVSAYHIDAVTGALQRRGEAVPLRGRPIHLSADAPSEHLLIAYNDPSRVTVHRIRPDGAVGREVAQSPGLDAGVYAHQVRVTPSNSHAIVVARGNDAARGKLEDPGALKLFRYDQGVLTPHLTVAPGGGYGFGPRHLDVHPTRPWVYVSIERQNQVCVFQWTGDSLAPTPLWTHETLSRPTAAGVRQFAGTIHVHPTGRYVYAANRADGTVDVGGRAVFSGGENSIVVFAVDDATGRLTPIQHEDTRGVHARTFHLDPTGRLLVAANMRPLTVREGNRLRTVPASLSLFRVASDGRLAYVRKYDVAVGRSTIFWMGMV